MVPSITVGPSSWVWDMVIDPETPELPSGKNTQTQVAIVNIILLMLIIYFDFGCKSGRTARDRALPFDRGTGKPWGYLETIHQRNNQSILFTSTRKSFVCGGHLPVCAVAVPLRTDGDRPKRLLRLNIEIVSSEDEEIFLLVFFTTLEEQNN